MWEFIADEKCVRSGTLTDVYFERTEEILRRCGLADVHVRMEVCARRLPEEWRWAVLAGVDDCLDLLEGRALEVRGLGEGSVFAAGEPVLEVAGRYIEICRWETVLLGFLCQSSGVATAAARCRVAAGDRMVASFGARRMHPAIAPLIDRSAYIGGCDAVAVVESARRLGMPPTGTVPHALVLMMGDTLEAMKAFDRIIGNEVKRVALVDTFGDERMEAVRLARALGDRLFAVRLDTPPSRRGDMGAILREVRWALDVEGFTGVKLFLSGGVTEKTILAHRDVVDAFGVGTYVSNAPVIDFSMDIVEIDGKPMSKKGKLPGSKDVYRCTSCGGRKVVPAAAGAPRCGCGGTMECLTVVLMRGGVREHERGRPDEVRSRVLSRLHDESPVL